MHIAQTSMILALVLLQGCGGKNKEKAAEDKHSEAPPLPPGSAALKDTPAEPAVAPEKPRPPTKPMGAEALKDFNYVYGNGSKAYKKLGQAAKKSDWEGVTAAAEAAIAADTWHLDAHRTLANALVHLGKYEAAKEHLSIALAGDWLRWGPTLEQDEALADLWKTEYGAEVKALNQAYRDEFLARVKNGIWLVGRRTRYKRPEKPGEQWAASRAELFAFDEETRRYLRLTHTGESLGGWIRSPSGSEIAWLSYSLVTLPALGSEGTPLLGRIRVGVVDAETLLSVSEGVRLRGDFARVDLQYRAGDELIVSVYDGQARWDHDPATDDEATGKYALDKQAGKFKKVDVPASDEDVLSTTLEKSWRTERGPRGYQVSGTSLSVDGSEKPIVLAQGESVTGVFFSPGKDKLAISTVTEACGEKPMGSIYVAEAATGELKHILRGNSDFRARWLDDKRFVYEDDYGFLRVYDAAEHKQTDMLKNSAGLALVGLGATNGILCTGEGQEVDDSDAARDGDGDGDGDGDDGDEDAFELAE